jgi:hypothetical protein
MPTIAAAGAGFLIAVLWFDLMFDAHVVGAHGDIAPDRLGSIRAYYRRVTTDAAPMNRLISLVMLATLASIALEIAGDRSPRWIGWLSLLAAGAAVGLAAARTVRNAARLGAGVDDLPTQSRLARRIYRDHLFCLAAMAAVLGMQASVGVLH